MNSIRMGSVFLLFASLLLVVAACGGAKTDSTASVLPPAASSAGVSSAPSASASAASGNSEATGTSVTPVSQTPAALPLPVNPPSVSTFPSSKSKRTGKVTAVRLADPLVGWAGGDGWIAGTVDGGKHWTVQLQHPYAVQQIFALNAKMAWASLDIGDKRGMKLIRTIDGGKHWTDAGAVPGYSFFHFVSEREAFAGNARTTDGGKTWTKLPAPAGTVGEPYFHDRLNGWAVTNGRQTFSIRKTTDGGKTWRTVLSRKSDVLPRDAVIRSTGVKDAWVELIGGSGMTQTSYSLFHTIDGGKTWRSVLAHSGAGSGPAPGFAMDQKQVPHNRGASPGTLYVASPRIAFMGGQCQACDKVNTIGKTTDGGKSWVDLPGEYPGHGEQQLAAADADHVWWITTDEMEASRMYVTADGGRHWKLVYTFDKPSQQ